MIFRAKIGNDTIELEEADFSEIQDLFSMWDAARQPPTPTTQAIRLGFTTLTITREGNYMLLLTVTQKASLTLDPRDAKGNPAVLDGVPVWTSSDAAVVEVTPAEDGLSAVVRAVGPVGAAQVNVTADARLGEEVVNLSGVLDVQVQAGEAVSLGIATGAPEEQ
jgi:hypothetical protein